MEEIGEMGEMEEMGESEKTLLTTHYSPLTTHFNN
jgi:hypothetical protein